MLAIPDIYRRIALTKQEVIVRAIGKSLSHANRIVGGKAGMMLEDSPQFWGSIGCGIIEASDEMVTISRREYEALRTLAQKALEEK